MNSSPKRDVEIFNTALQLSGEERIAYLDQVCRGDNSLREKVEKLLKVHAQIGDFLEPSTQDVPKKPKSETVIGEKPGDRIGRYKLLEQIGEGGCGVVFMAEQREDVRRRVALKIIKPGMDTKNVIARFEAERQALALMDHPNIAKVFDAGATESGRPFFVMELVRGIKITEYCNENSLTLEERLKLFIQICQAIQHAHQKGIIHRDIKPSNILVTRTEQGEAMPVVIDFGIAKATTNQPLTDKTLFTAFEMLIGTPAYMSPEQAAFTSIDVDTRSDIYSLGALLYELLTGLSPFNVEDLARAGIEETRRVIREKEAIRPSARLTKMTEPDLTAVALRTKTDPPKLIRTISGDLDWIVMKAMEKDRTRRYETAESLAIDVQRFLTQEPVSARPPSKIYMLKKMALRNKLLFFCIGITLIFFVVSFVVVFLSLVKERQADRAASNALEQTEIEKVAAQADAAKSREMTSFIENMLKGVGPSVARGEDTTMLRMILNQTDERIGAELTNQPEVEAELRTLIGGLYLDIGSYDRAEKSLRMAVDIDRKQNGDKSDADLASALNELSMTTLAEGKMAEAESTALEAISIRRRLFGEDNADVAISLDNLADLYRREGKVDEAMPLVQEALRIKQKLFGDESLQAADTLRTMCILLGDEGKREESATLAEKVLKIRLNHLGTNDPLVAGSFDDLAWADGYIGKLKESESLERNALEIRRKVLGDAHPDVAQSLSYSGQFMGNAGQLSDAEAVLGAAYSIQCKLAGEDNPQTLYTLEALGSTLEKEDKWADAEQVFRQALAEWRKQQGTYGTRALYDLSGLVCALEGEGKLDEAWADLDEVLTPAYMKDPASADVLWQKITLLGRKGKWQEALTNATFLIKYQPNDEYGYHVCCGLVAMTHDAPAYELLCQKILATFTNSTDPSAAERIADDCLLLKNSGADLAAADKLATDSVTFGSFSPEIGYYYACKALSEYRLGHFAEATKWAQLTVNAPEPYAKAKGYAILAMTRWRLGLKDAALNALRQGNLQAPSFSATDKKADLGDEWVAWIFARVALDEATDLIGPGAASRNWSNRI
jgi:eukaryotic-like serine/threonine-protein kinase